MLKPGKAQNARGGTDLPETFDWRWISTKFSKSTDPIWSFNFAPYDVQSVRVLRKWRWWRSNGYLLSQSLKPSRAPRGNCTGSQKI